MIYESFCGGIFETNCYLLEAAEGHILFDAPDGACDWLERRGTDLKLLLLTHGHIDHVQDAARIKKRFNCQLGCSAETVPMISDRDFFRGFGFELEIEPVSADFAVAETPARIFLGTELQVTSRRCDRGRCGDAELLFNGFRKKLLSLGDNVTVLPGHGPPTKIGTERLTNPFLA